MCWLFICVFVYSCSGIRSAVCSPEQERDRETICMFHGSLGNSGHQYKSSVEAGLCLALCLKWRGTDTCLPLINREEDGDASSTCHHSVTASPFTLSPSVSSASQSLLRGRVCNTGHGRINVYSVYVCVLARGCDLHICFLCFLSQKWPVYRLV